MKKIFLILGLMLLVSPVLAENFLISIPSEIPSYYVMNLDSQKSMNEYSLQFTNSLNGSFSIKGSNDLSSWTNLDTVENESFTANATYYYEIDSPDYYQYYLILFEEGFDSPSTNLFLVLNINPYSLQEGNITVYEKGVSYIYWIWNPSNISRVMVDSEVLSEPSTGYFIYSNLIEDTSHKISLFYENGTVIYTDTKTDKSPLTSILNFAWERIWLIVGIILILLSIVSSGWLALIASVIFLTNFGVYLADDDPMSAIICVSLGIVAILVSKFQVVRE
jgi:hypothetical protein